MDLSDQKTFLNAGDRWRPSWADIAENAGIVKLYARGHYSYLCSHAHSGWQSVANLNSPLSDEDVERLWLTTSATLGVSAASLIRGLDALFPGCLGCLTPEDTKLVDQWIGLGRTEEVKEEQFQTKRGTRPNTQDNASIDIDIGVGEATIRLR